MPYPGQVFEDPEYYEDEEQLLEEFEEQERAKDLENFDPFETVNS